PLPPYFLFLLAFLPSTILAAAAVLIMPQWRPALTDRAAATRYVLALNLTTMINWVAFLEALWKISADLCAAIVVGGMPLTMLLLERLFDKRLMRPRDMLAALLVAAGVALMGWDQLEKHPSAVSELLGGILLALISCLFAAANNWLVGRLRT